MGAKLKIYVFDIDGTICSNTFGEYAKAEPIRKRINLINKLFDQGNIIKLFTARGSTTKIDWKELTKEQMTKWGVKYHELILGKPEGDFYIDDKGVFCDDWFNNNLIDNKVLNNDTDFIVKSLLEAKDSIKKVLDSKQLQLKLLEVAESIKQSLLNRNKIIFAGNGGSFADAQHLSAEFISKLNKPRGPLSSIVLGANCSSISAIGNDYGYENVFSREFEGLAQKGDLLIAITTSGMSPNIINLIDVAERMNINYYVLTGITGGKLASKNDKLIKVPSDKTTVIQQLHITLGHIICDLAQGPFLNESD